VSPDERDALLDVLSDLRHDLGKYLRLPLAMLPADAAADEVREAARTALIRTRRGPRGVSTAAEIWSEARHDLEPLARWRAGAGLAEAIEAALRWTGALDAPTPLDRAALFSDLGGVTTAIDALLLEVQGG
jgi:hypothetical protein